MKTKQTLTKIGIVAIALSLSGGSALAGNFGDIGESRNSSVYQSMTLTLFPGFRDDSGNSVASSFYSREQGQPAFADELRDQDRRLDHGSSGRVNSDSSTVGNVLKLEF